MNPSLSVDSSRGDRMQIRMNLTFPSIPCFLLGIDVMDVAGEHQNGAGIEYALFLDHLMHKSRLSKTGQLIKKTQGSKL